ncbi:MAG: hypothetical protein IPI83_14775 [Sphingomonadales bacterium]|nr:hypothetical protein [Sphingomonadales bacterium]
MSTLKMSWRKRARQIGRANQINEHNRGFGKRVSNNFSSFEALGCELGQHIVQEPFRMRSFFIELPRRKECTALVSVQRIIGEKCDTHRGQKPCSTKEDEPDTPAPYRIA